MIISTNPGDHFAGVGKMIRGGKKATPKIKLDEKGAGGLLGDVKNNERTDKP